jgi:hypothetical protein
MKFKKGDILEFDGIGSYAAKKGATAICKGYEIDEDGESFIEVQWIRNELSEGQDDGGYYESQFTKVEERSEYEKFLQLKQIYDELKVEEVSSQEENRIFEEIKKEKVMKFDFERGKRQLLEWMDNEFDCSYGQSFQHIKELSTIADIQDEVESFRRFEESWVGKTAAVNRATTMREVFEALEDTSIENDDNFIIELFTTEQ